MDRDSYEKSIINKVNLSQIISSAIVFVVFVFAVTLAIILKCFSWKFIFLILIVLLLISAMIVNNTIRIKNNYKEAVTKDLTQMMLTLAFIIDAKYIVMITNKIVKTSGLLINYDFMIVFNCVVVSLLVLYAVLMQILIPIKLSKIYKPVWAEKKRLKEETKKYEEAIKKLQSQVKGTFLDKSEGENENEKN